MTKLVLGTVAASPQRPLCEAGKPALDLVEPGGMRGREMKMETGMAEQPPVHARHLVRGQVVEHDVRVEFGRDLFVDRVEEANEFNAPVGRVRKLGEP